MVPPAGSFSATPPAPQMRGPQHQQHVAPPAVGNSNAAAVSSNRTGGSRSQASAQEHDPNCLDGTTETRESGSMVDWMLSVASKPRVGGGSSSNSSSRTGPAATSGNGRHSDEAMSAGVKPPAPPASSHPASTSNCNGRGGSRHASGGRGGVVTALAVQAPEAGVQTAPLPAELALAPEDCEPDWQLRSGGAPGFEALSLHPKQQGQRSHRGSGDMHPAQQQHVAALRRHNNQLLAEDGVLSNVMPWTVSASSQGTELPSEAVAATKPQPAAANAHAKRMPVPQSTVEPRPHGQVQLDDYII